MLIVNSSVPSHNVNTLNVAHASDNLGKEGIVFLTEESE